MRVKNKASRTKEAEALIQAEMERRLLAFISLSDFCKQAWKVLEPSTPLAWNWHHDLICGELTRVKDGEIRRLLINVMPRSLKSLIVSVFFPCWLWLHDPAMAFLCMSYSGDLANEHSQKRRRLIESELYSRMPGGENGRFLEEGRPPELADDKNRIKEFENDARGVMIARGLEGSVTGTGGNILLFDDPNNPEEVESDTIRERALKNFKDYSVTRQNDPKLAACIVVQQRTHEEDVSGYVLAKLAEPQGWTVVILPTKALEHQTFVYKMVDPVTFETIDTITERSPGDFLHPERFGEEEDLEARLALGSYMYAGRHQQRPSPAEGGIFSNKWRYYQQLPQQYQLALSVDASFGSKSKTASYVVIGLWAVAYPRFYRIAQRRERMSFNETKKAIREMIETWEPILGAITTKLVEKKANGAAIIEDLSAEFPGIIPIEVGDADKKARAIAVSPMFEAGNVFLAEGADWTEYQNELELFPNYPTDDQVDETSQLLQYFASKYRQQPRRRTGTVSYSNV